MYTSDGTDRDSALGSALSFNDSRSLTDSSDLVSTIIDSQIYNYSASTVEGTGSVLSESDSNSNDYDPSCFNIANSESILVDHLCTCGNRDLPWCFVHDKVIENQNCIVNKITDFGFMCDLTPPVPLFRPGKVLKCKNLVQWAYEAHSIVAASGLPNYQCSRIKVPTELKINNWRALCGNYKDQVLLDYLEYGFPLCVDKQALAYITNVTNYSSAEQYPHDMSSYFQKELKHKAIVGPCNDLPFSVHYSPLLSRPKPDDTRRVIVNLSAPQGCSVNDCIAKDYYDGVPYMLKYPSVDNIINAVQELGPDVLLSKIDVSRAFRNLRVDPGDFDVLGMKWQGNSYLDISMPMGIKMGSALCQRTTDVIRHVMTSRDVRMYNYIDDVICIHKRHNADAEFDVLHSLFEFLGVPVNPKKVVRPCRSLTCMGIEVDLDMRQLRIPHTKIIEILDMCQLITAKRVISRKQLQSLLGKLLYVHRCVPPARIFVNRLLNTLRNANEKIKVNSDMLQDIMWFQQFLRKFNGKIMFKDTREAFDVYIDASLTGMGACWNENAYAVSRHILATATLSITQLEMLNVLIAMRIFGHCWEKQKIKFHIDNKAVVYALSNGRIKDKYLQSVARSIWLIAAIKDIDIEYVHISGVYNVKADVLSRVFQDVHTVEKLDLFENYTWWPVDGKNFYPNLLV